MDNFTQKEDRFLKILSLTENKIRRKKKKLQPNPIDLYRIIPDMENYLKVEWIMKASWATLALVLEDRFLSSGKASVWPCPSGVAPASPGQDSKNFHEGLPRVSLPPCSIGHRAL